MWHSKNSKKVSKNNLHWTKRRRISLYHTWNPDGETLQVPWLVNRLFLNIQILIKSFRKQIKKLCKSSSQTSNQKNLSSLEAYSFPQLHPQPDLILLHVSAFRSK